MPKLSIIILTFNSVKFIKLCLDSVFSQDYKDFEVILVDNGSEDNTISFLRKSFPTVKIIENEENLGACKARNQGIEISRGQYILTLDCDVILEKDFLKRIMNFAENSEESVGMLQPKILTKDRKTIYSVGIYLSHLRRFFDIGKGKPDDGQFDYQRYIFGTCAAAAFYKRQMLEEISQDNGYGYFDERFFFLAEDVDLSWRAQKKNWKAKFYPEAVCYHYGNSSRLDKKFRQYLCFRNRYFCILKNENKKGLIKILFSFLIYDLPRFLYLLVFNKYTLTGLREIVDFYKKGIKKSLS